VTLTEKETTMKFRSNLNGALVGGALAAALVLPGVSFAGGIEGAWDQFHNSHVSAGGSAPAGGIVGAWDGFHQNHVAEQTVESASEASSLQNPWNSFHQSHIGSSGSQG
jgi:hypothetical protein